MFGAEGGLVTLADGDKKKTRDLAKASQPTWSTMMMKLLTINMMMILIKMATKYGDREYVFTVKLGYIISKRVFINSLNLLWRLVHKILCYKRKYENFLNKKNPIRIFFVILGFLYPCFTVFFKII